MYTTVAFSESQDTAGVMSYVAGVQDPHVRVEGDNIITPEALPNLAGVFALGSTITQAQLESPSLRRLFLYDIPALQVGATPGSRARFNSHFFAPISLDKTEILRFLAAEAAAGAERETGLVFLSDGPAGSVSGDIRTVLATVSAGTGAYSWANAPINFSQTLPAGRYQLVGARCQSTTLICSRFVFVGGTWRPGVLGVTGIGQEELQIFRNGNLGVLGEFEHDQPPTVDSFAVNAGENVSMHLDLIKVG